MCDAAKDLANHKVTIINLTASCAYEEIDAFILQYLHRAFEINLSVGQFRSGYMTSLFLAERLCR